MSEQEFSLTFSEAEITRLRHALAGEVMDLQRRMDAAPDEHLMSGLQAWMRALEILTGKLYDALDSPDPSGSEAHDVEPFLVDGSIEFDGDRGSCGKVQDHVGPAVVGLEAEPVSPGLHCIDEHGKCLGCFAVADKGFRDPGNVDLRHDSSPSVGDSTGTPEPTEGEIFTRAEWERVFQALNDLFVAYRAAGDRDGCAALVKMCNDALGLRLKVVRP